jgi:DNA-binding response OmpR family regulator
MKKILIVEDELAYVELLRDALIAQGYNVIEAYDGNTGLEKAINEKPDVILLDLRMPVMDGVTMLKKLRETAWGKDANVLILTNLDDSTTISKVMNEKVSRYIVKSNASLSSILSDLKVILQEE